MNKNKSMELEKFNLTIVEKKLINSEINQITQPKAIQLISTKKTDEKLNSILQTNTSHELSENLIQIKNNSQLSEKFTQMKTNENLRDKSTQIKSNINQKYLSENHLNSNENNLWLNFVNEINQKKSTQKIDSNISNKSNLIQLNSTQLIQFKHENQENNKDTKLFIKSYSENSNNKKCLTQFVYLLMCLFIIALIGFQLSIIILFFMDRFLWNRYLAKKFNRIF